MNAKPFGATDLEPERYEFRELLADSWQVDRREFLGILGAGLLVFCLRRESNAQPAGFAPQETGDGTRRVDAWLRIGEDGRIAVFTGKVEVGQNARTSLTQAVADELRVAMEDVRMVMGDTDHVPFDRGTFGSLTTPTMVPQLRRAAAAARRKLIELAAEAWKVGPDGLVAENGQVRQTPAGRSISYSELARGQRLVAAIDEDEPTTPADQWTIAGRSAPRVDGRDFVTGRHRFSADLTAAGMLVGKILRPPAFGASLQKLDPSGAEAIDGVTVVHEENFVGLTAPDEPTARRALRALRAEWSRPEPSISQETLFDTFRARLDTPEDSEFEKTLQAADVRLEASYEVAYIAHVPMEPRSALANWEGDRLTVWTGTQRPFGVRQELARAFGLPPNRVRVLVPDTGGGFGGKHTGEAAIEAARLARASEEPVRLIWTRQEEMTWAYFRPAGLIRIEAGAGKDGRLTAWRQQNVNSGRSGIDSPYEIAVSRSHFHEAESPLRQGSYRALAATANHFARESSMDELASRLKMDPLNFRRENLKAGRLLDVLNAAAERFGWDGAKPAPDHGFGLACGWEKGGIIANCVEIAIDRSAREVRIVRAVAAFDCGAISNPDQLKGQVEGALIMGIGGALFEAIHFEEGRILNDRLSRYRVPRFGDVPTIEVILIDRKDVPSAGAGETPIVAIAPAIGNAIFQATGKRLRSLPLIPNGLDLT